MTALPPIADYTGAAVTEGGQKTFMTSLRGFLAGLLGTTGTPAAARAALELETRATVASHATTADIWAATGHQIDWTGTATTTAFPDAPQAGAKRTLICAAAASFTAGANLLIDGYASGATVTLSANDIVIVQAIAVDTFRLSIVRYNGMPAQPKAARTDSKQTYTAQQTPMSGTLTDGATIDWNGDSNGQVVTLTTTAARTFNAPTNIVQHAIYALVLTTGGYTPAWNAAYKWPSGGTPAGLASGTYVFTFVGGAANTLIPTGPGYLTGA